ncbi:MAG TPA: tetratricopeptide repeat protein [Candidatus Eisenbacteria bacterium]|nr:tetratricopeptide repeat protein [Candidatus Eisenbacteria bacterium]
MDRSLAIRKRAQQLVQKGQVDAALAEFEKLFDSGEKDPYDFILVADLLAKRGAMQEAVRRYRQAMQEYGKAELFKNAIAVCKKILRISKEDLAIHRSLGELYSKEGLYGDAQIHYLEFAEGSIRRHEYDAALDVVEQVLKLSPDNDDLSEKYVGLAQRAEKPERGGRELLRRAERMEQRGQSAEAAQLRERASALAPGILNENGASASVGTGFEDPLSPSSHSAGYAAPPSVFEPSARSMAEALSPPAEIPAPPPNELRLDTGGSKFETARPFEEIAAAPPLATSRPAETGPVRHEDLAAEYLRSGQVDAASEEFWKGAELAFFRGDLSRARALLEALLKLSPLHEAALRRLVDLTVQTEDRPGEAEARYNLAEIYLGQEEWALARAEYMRVLELDSSNDRARMRVARLDAMNGEISGTPADITGTVDLDSLPSQRPSASVRVRDDQPSSVDSLVDLEEIIDEFKAGVSNTISGEDHESHYDLGMAYMEMGLYDEAIQEFQVASKGPIELKCLEMIALCYLEKNEPATAARELTRALEIPGHGPDETISIRYNLGMAFERLGNLDRALQHFEEVYLLNVDFFKVATKVRELKQRIAAGRDA